MSDTVLRTLGWRSLLINGDPCVLDRWLWLRAHLLGGKLRTFDAGCGNGGFSIYAAHIGNEVVAASFPLGQAELPTVDVAPSALRVTLPLKPFGNTTG